MRLRAAVAWMERHQILLYLTAILVGCLVGQSIPDIAKPLEAVVNLALGLLLYATFLGLPLSNLRQAARNGRFLVTVLIINFLVIPVIVFLISRLVAHDYQLLVGVLLVLLTPCIDYVIVFTSLSGGAKHQLLAATPLLMLGQMLLLPLYLWGMVGSDLLDRIEPEPFVHAFLWLIVVPLLGAAITKWLAAQNRSRPVQATSRAVGTAAQSLMVPFMMATLIAVVASQIFSVGQQWSALVSVIPVYVLFVLVMIPVGLLVGRIFRVTVPEKRAIVFSGVTRNSLVVLPLALAMPSQLSLVPLVVVTQTLVELIAMVVMVWAVPRLIPATG